MQPQLNPPAPQQPDKSTGASWERKTNAETSPPSNRWAWIGGLLVVAAIAGYLYWSGQQDRERQTRLASAGIRTFTVAAGGLIENTLRLTGQTGPEKYSSLLTPQLRGARGQGGRGDGSSFQSRERGGRTSSGGGGASSGSSSSVVSTSASASGGSSSGMSAGMRSSTSRVGGGSSGSRPAASSGAASNSMGADGLGSSAASLPGGGGPGGGGGGPQGGGGGGGGPRGGGGGGGGGISSEFMLVLQDAAPAGSRVKKGDTVAEFDRQYMLTRLDDFRATVAQADASYKKLLAQIEVNKKAHNRTIENAIASVEKSKLDMQTTPVLSFMDSERRRLALEEAEARLRQLKEEVRYVDIGLAADKRTADLELQQSKLELKRAEVNADRMLMKAPIDGLVVMQNTLRGTEFDQIKIGDQLMPGMMFMQIVEPSSMVINAAVNQADVQRLRLGQKAHVRFDAFPGLELPAHISAIGSVARASRFRPDWVKDMPLVLKLDRMDPRVIPDLSVSCNIILDSSDASAIVPREGIFRDSDDAKPYVYARAQSGKWDRREVETGLASNVGIAIKSGLRPGEVIALDRPTVGVKPETVATAPAPDRAQVAVPLRRRWLAVPSRWLSAPSLYRKEAEAFRIG